MQYSQFTRSSMHLFADIRHPYLVVCECVEACLRLCAEHLQPCSDCLQLLQTATHHSQQLVVPAAAAAAAAAAAV
jgi:hypothetical protein